MATPLSIRNIYIIAFFGLEAVENLAKLDLAFTDAKWTGNAVPTVGVCERDGGSSMSPPLVVRNIPSAATDIIVEFNDLSYPPLSSGGGHGAIRVSVAGQAEVKIPSIQGETFKLPSGVVMESAHGGTVGGAGAYLDRSVTTLAAAWPWLH